MKDLPRTESSRRKGPCQPGAATQRGQPFYLKEASAKAGSLTALEMPPLVKEEMDSTPRGSCVLGSRPEVHEDFEQPRSLW